MINKMISSVGIGVTGAGGTGELYIDKTDDNYGIGENLTFNASAEKNIAIGAHALNSTSGVALRNIGIGHNTMTVLTTADDNVAIGVDTLLTHKSGSNNVAIGSDAMDGTGATGDTGAGSTDNVAIGKDALGGAWANTQSDYNIAIGTNAMGGALDDVGGSVAIGVSALGALTSGAGNIAVGFETLKANTIGANNIAIGYQAMSVHDGGLRNIAIGRGAMKATDAGSVSEASDDNIFIGYSAGGGTWANQDNSHCIGIGSSALEGALQGNYTDGTIAIGHSALYTLTSGAGNIAIGYQALTALLDGSSNTAVGYNALLAETEGFYSTAVGYGALTSQNGIDGAVSNTAVGFNAGAFVTTGINSTFVGSEAGQGITGAKLIGDNNTAFGTGSGKLLQGAAHSNTFIGSTAGNVATTAVENTCLGFNCDIQDATATNQVVIGNNVTGTADNQVHIGNDSNHLHTAFSSDSWAATSDIRQKKNIQDDTLGLEFINSLRTTTYQHKSPSEFPKEWTSYDADNKESMDGDKVFHSLIAQEVKQSLDDIGCETFGGWSVDPDGRQRVSRTSFVTPLIKAIQELSAQVEELKNKQ